MVESGSGVGLGESSPMAEGFGYSSDTPQGCWQDLTNTIAPSLLDRSFSSAEEIAATASTWTGSRFAAAGRETALWDLLGQARHATIAELLGGVDSRISMGIESGLAVGLYPTIVELIKTIEPHLEAGYRRVKIKIEPGRDVELVRAVRQHLGDIPLMVDANAAYTVADLDVFRDSTNSTCLCSSNPWPPPTSTASPPCKARSRHRFALTRPRTRSSGPPRRSRSELAGSSISSSTRRWIRTGVGHSQPLPSEGDRLLGRLHARAGDRTGARHPSGHAEQLQVPQRSPAQPAGSSTTTWFP